MEYRITFAGWDSWSPHFRHTDSDEENLADNVKYHEYTGTIEPENTAVVKYDICYMYIMKEGPKIWINGELMYDDSDNLIKKAKLSTVIDQSITVDGIKCHNIKAIWCAKKMIHMTIEIHVSKGRYIDQFPNTDGVVLPNKFTKSEQTRLDNDAKFWDLYDRKGKIYMVLFRCQYRRAKWARNGVKYVGCQKNDNVMELAFEGLRDLREYYDYEEIGTLHRLCKYLTHTQNFLIEKITAKHIDDLDFFIINKHCKVKVGEQRTNIDTGNPTMVLYIPIISKFLDAVC